MRTTPLAPAYVIAARRTALGRIGGLHRTRRLDELAAPVIAAALADCGLTPGRVDELIVGNATQGGNPARLIALAAGLPDHVPATTIDRQECSGLDAIIAACRLVGAGDAAVVVAGGAESPSTAPWRVAKPKSLYQLPQFLRLEPTEPHEGDEPDQIDASEDMSRQLGIGRAQQDAWALRSHLKAGRSRENRAFVGEIVPLRANAEEARDQSAVEPSPEDLERLTPFLRPGGTLTPGNTSAVHDGAAMVVVVSEAVWQELGQPRAIRLVGSAVRGVAPDQEAAAPMQAMQSLYGRLHGFNPKDIGVVELSEASAAQALAFSSQLGLDDDIINPDGGAVVRGRPFGAAGAVLVVRLFTRMVRQAETAGRVSHGIAALGAAGGMGLAALFEAV